MAELMKIIWGTYRPTSRGKMCSDKQTDKRTDKQLDKNKPEKFIKKKKHTKIKTTRKIKNRIRKINLAVFQN